MNTIDPRAEPPEESNSDLFDNPLWLVVIASACLFVALAVLTLVG